MGRIKTTAIKNIASKVYEDNKEKFSDNFENNKEIVNELLIIPSKKLRNIVAGYITTLKKREA